MEKNSVAGISLGGGRKDNFFFCLLEYYQDQERWFLKSLLRVQDEEQSGDKVIGEWSRSFNLKNLVVDFPQSKPACETCKLVCPGIELCPLEQVTTVFGKIKELLELDKKKYDEDPKKYERDRNLSDLFQYHKELFVQKNFDNLLSKSFKRKLKKGFIPYWHRPIDFWIWCEYYDQLLELFNITYDSYGHTPLMVLSRFNYLRRHFPPKLEIYEAHYPIILIELLRSKVIQLNELKFLNDFELGLKGREIILIKLEKEFNLFVYQADRDLLIKNPKAFASFLLAVAGQRKLLNQVKKLPYWADDSQVQFIVPLLETSGK